MSVFSPPTTPLVLLHGAGGDASVWDAQTEWLARRGWTTLALEFPAHGATAAPPLPSIEALSDWVWRQLDARQTGPVVLAGHSMGSLVALHAAGQRPAQVRGLALLGTAFPMRVSKRLLAQAEAEPEEAIDSVVRWSYAQAEPFAPIPGFQSAESYRACLLRQQANWAEGSVLASDLRACDRYDGGESAARQWGGPTLFLLGEHDRMTPPAGAASLREALPGSRTVLLDCGHSLMAEAPHAVAHALADWMERDLFAAG
ncbi:MAG: alpha/beta fold hydrolase [Thiomonas sp.]